MRALGNQAFDHATGDSPSLLADAVAQFRYPGSIGTAGAIDGLGRDVETGHDAWELAHKVEFRDIGGKTEFRYENQPAPICCQQFVQLFWIFWLCLLLGNQHAVAVGEFHLHVRNTGTSGCSRGVLDWELRDSRQLPEPGEITLLGNERVF